MEGRVITESIFLYKSANAFNALKRHRLRFQREYTMRYDSWAMSLIKCLLLKGPLLGFVSWLAINFGDVIGIGAAENSWRFNSGSILATKCVVNLAHGFMAWLATTSAVFWNTVQNGFAWFFWFVRISNASTWRICFIRTKTQTR